MMNQLFNKFNVVKGYNLDEFQVDVNYNVVKLVYVSYDETIRVSLLEDVFDKLLLRMYEGYIEGYGCDDSYEFTEKLTEMVYMKAEQYQSRIKEEAEQAKREAERKALREERQRILDENRAERKREREARYDEATQRFLDGNKAKQVVKETKKKPFWKKDKSDAIDKVVVESKPVVTKESSNNNNNSPVVVKLQELMVKALEEGDFDAYDKLEERLNRISK